MKFLASVGVGQLFRIEDGEPKLFATARTLTETSLSFSSQSTDVTEGAGEQLADTFTGQGRLKIDLTEVNFDFKYLSALLNPASVPDPKVFFSERPTVGDNQTINISKVPAVLGNQFGLDKYLIFYKKYGAPESEWQSFTIDRATAQGKTLTLPDATLMSGDEVCVKYFTSAPQAQSVLIGANFMPQELMLVLTTKLISSPTGRIEDGEVEGEIVLRIPRYKLDANFNLQMAMSSFSSVPISGTALAYQDASDPFSLNYGDIVENIKSEDSIKTGLVSIYVDAESGLCFGLYKDGHTALLPISNEVPNGMFNDCPTLASVELPDTVEYIASEAFSGDSNLETITLFSVDPPQLQATTAFPSGAIFYVLPSSLTTYRGASVWDTIEERIYAAPTVMLLPPTVSISGNYLSITSLNTAVDFYKIYVNSVYWRSIEPSSGVLVENFDISDLAEEAGSYSITAAAVKAGFIDSPHSVAAEYVVYSMNKNTVLCSIGGWPSHNTIAANTATSLQIVKPAGGYCDFPQSVLVSNASVEYSAVTGELVIFNPTGPVSLTIECVPWVFAISSTLFQCSILPGSATTITAYDKASVIVQANTSNYYQLPSSVTVSNVDLDSYNSSTGTIILSNPRGSKGDSISLSVAATPMTFSIITNITDGELQTVDGNPCPESIQAHSSLQLKVVPNQLPSPGYDFPVAIYSSNVTLTYNAINGALTVENPTGNVSLTASCPGKLLFVSNGDGTCEVSKGNWDGEILTIPSLSPDNDSVVSVEEDSFYDSSELARVSLPETLTAVGVRAFAACDALTAIEVSSNNPVLHSAGNCLVKTATNELIFGCGNSIIPSDGSVTSIDAYAFYDCGSLESVAIPDSVVFIGEGAFQSCESLSAVTFGNNSQLTSIADCCFCGDEAIVSFEIPGSVSNIGSQAFFGCSFSSVTIPNAVSSVGDYAFSQCEQLTAIMIPEGLTNLGEGVFGSCTSLAKVEFEGQIDIIKTQTFAHCINLQTIVYPGYWSQVIKINGWDQGTGAYAVVSWSEGLDFSILEANQYSVVGIGTCVDTSLFIPPQTPDGYNVVSIGSSAFEQNLSLTEVIVSEGITQIGINAFYNCSSITSILLPDSLKNLTDNPFSGCSSLQYNLYDNAAYLGNKENPYVVLMKAVNTNITSCDIPNNTRIICYEAFNLCSLLETISIPSNIEQIGVAAFEYCENLQYTSYDNADYLGNTSNPYVVLAKAKNTSIYSCVFQPGTRIVYDYAFNRCEYLSNISLSAGVVNIGIGVFKSCSRLVSVNLNSNLRSISEYAFSGCSALSSVTIPNSVKSIGNSAFDGCSALTSITIGSGVTSIGNSALYKCSALTTLVIPDSVKSVGTSAFSLCTSLKSVTIPNGVTNIGWYAFDWCPIENASLPASAISKISRNNLKTVVITGGENIDDSAFSNCSTLTSVTIVDNTIANIGNNAFAYCYSLSSVTFGNGLMSIGNNAFTSCYRLADISIPNGVINIGDWAFSSCDGFASVTLPVSVESIGDSAFKYCGYLNSISVLAPTPPSQLGQNAFTSTNNCPIYVPASSVTAYQTASGWSNYASRIQAIPS